MQKCVNGIFLIPFFILSFTALAQQNSVSPYSRLGVGDLQRKNYTQALGIGGATIGLKDAMNVDMSNPASYVNLQLTTFDLGVQARLIEQQQANPDVFVKNYQGNIRYFAFGIPLKEWWGMGFGVQPYSYKGYNITSNRAISDGTEIEDNFIGSGSMSQIYWGHAFKPVKNLSVGANVNFLFGKLQEQNTTSFEGDIFNSWEIENIGVRGTSFDFGAQYQIDFGKNYQIGLGATYTNQSDLKGTLTRDLFVASNGGTSIDSLSSDDELTGTVTLPSEMKFGISIGKKTDLSMNYAWSISADFELYNGSEFKTFAGHGNLADGYRAEFGAQITPALAFGELSKRNKYASLIEYRIGGFYGDTPYMIDGQGISEYGMSFGVGLPVRHKNLAPGEQKFSMVNIGAILGRRGSVDNGLIQENYLNIYLGVRLSDKWFIKYKYR